MEKLQFSERLNCREVKTLFPDLLLEKLGAEQEGRVQGHLLICEECSAAFAEEIDTALQRGDLPPIEVPPLTMLQTQDAVSVEHARFGVMWREVVNLVNEEKDWATQKLTEAGRWIDQTISEIWNVPVRVQGGVRTRGAAVSQRLDATVIGANGEPSGTTVTFEINEAACITENGQFILSISTQDQKSFGGRIICTVNLRGNKKVSFESRVGQDGSVRFHAQGLPNKQADIPRMDIALYLLPSAQ